LHQFPKKMTSCSAWACTYNLPP